MRTVIADRYRGRPPDSPNDVVVASDGADWFTDPSYGILSDCEGRRAESEQVRALHCPRLGHFRPAAQGAHRYCRQDGTCCPRRHQERFRLPSLF